MAVLNAARGDGALTQLNDLIRQMASRGENRRKQLITQSRLIEGAARRRVQTELQSVDGAVKAHERAHMAILGGAAAGGIQYSYVRGPGGTRYAVGGSIKIDLQPVPGNPEATIAKARRVRMAALAPGNSSAADLRVAARAYRLEQQAQEKLEEERKEERAAEREEAREESWEESIAEAGRDNPLYRAGPLSNLTGGFPDGSTDSSVPLENRGPVYILA